MAAQLSTLLRGRVTLVWLGLIAATLVSWRIGTDHGLSASLATPLVLLVAFVKVRFVGMYFMELRSAPLLLRAAFEGWCLVVCSVLIAMYLTAGAG
jgi:caa(3)-type oxidase subunit IV